MDSPRRPVESRINDGGGFVHNLFLTQHEFSESTSAMPAMASRSRPFTSIFITDAPISYRKVVALLLLASFSNCECMEVVRMLSAPERRFTMPEAHLASLKSEFAFLPPPSAR